MRIAYVCADRGIALSGRGGSAIHVREFANSLVRRGSDVTVFSAGPVGGGAGELPDCSIVDLAADATLNELRARLAKELRAAGGGGIRAAETYSLLLNQSLIEALEWRRGRVDVVYERHSLWSFAGLQFARRHRLPFFLEVNAPLTDQQQQYRELEMIETARVVERYLFSGADRLLVTTGSLCDYVHARGASRRNVRILPCGVSRAMFPESNRLGPREGEEFVIGFVGSLKPWHGVQILLDAFVELRKISSAYRLLIVGDGPMMPEVRSFCRANRLGRAVMLAGSVDHGEVGRYLARMDVGLAPYPDLRLFYFSPLKVWEYAAAGVPIVASASGDLPDRFPHRSAALLHPPGRVGKIVKHVEKLRKNPELGRRLARRARRVAKLHTWDRLAARFATMAERLVARRIGEGSS